MIISPTFQVWLITICAFTIGGYIHLWADRSNTASKAEKRGKVSPNGYTRKQCRNSALMWVGMFILLVYVVIFWSRKDPIIW